MKRNLFFALALMLVMGIGGLVCDASAAQNTNSSTTMSNMGSKPNMTGRRGHPRHGRRHGRRHRRGRRGSNNKNANK
jgi:hypothetical protein